MWGQVMKWLGWPKYPMWSWRNVPVGKEFSDITASQCRMGARVGSFHNWRKRQLKKVRRPEGSWMRMVWFLCFYDCFLYFLECTVYRSYFVLAVICICCSFSFVHKIYLWKGVPGIKKWCEYCGVIILSQRKRLINLLRVTSLSYGTNSY